MYKIIAALKKEILLLLRDPAGLGILFVLPVLMVFLITVIQDSAFRTISENKIDIVLADTDNDTLGRAIKEGFNKSGVFIIHSEKDGKPYSELEARSLTAMGNYKIGIILSKGASENIRSHAKKIIASSFPTDSSQTQTEAADTTNKGVIILFDPAVQASYKATVLITLDKYISQIESGILVRAFSEEMATLIPGMKPIDLDASTGLEIKEEYAVKEDSKISPNSVQHNVPAWTVFAMFFIVIPLATNLVREKDNGIDMRLRTMPGSFLFSLTGKVIAYIIVCLIQFVLMLCVGFFILPKLGLPELVLGRNVAELVVMAFFCALAGTGFGVMVGSLATTHDQAASFGSISVIIMAALGGIWVPAFVMPSAIKTISSFSPLNWALNGFYDIFLREADFTIIWPQLLKLLVFSVLMFSISVFAKSRRYS